MAKQAHLEHLGKVSLFSSCSKKDLERIAKATTELIIPAGKVLVDQGQTGKEAFIIVDGEATARRNGKKIATLGPGDMVGELSLLDRGPRTATVTTDTETTVLVLDQRGFSGVLDEVPALAHKMMAALAARVRELDRKVYG